MFEATARLTIRDGELEAFKQQAAEMVRLMRENGGKPLRYDWFISDDETECEVTFYAEPSPALAHALETMGVTSERFSFFQGLDADEEV